MRSPQQHRLALLERIRKHVVRVLRAARIQAQHDDSLLPAGDQLRVLHLLQDEAGEGWLRGMLLALPGDLLTASGEEHGLAGRCV